MRKTKKYALILFLLLFLVSSVYSIEVSLKLSGGLSFLRLENTNSVLQDWAEWHKKNAENNKWTLLKGEVANFRSAFDFEGEIIVSITSFLAIGFGAGYIYGELSEEKTEVSTEQPQNILYNTHPTKASALPLTFSGYIMIPVKNKLKFFLKGGTGFIWAKFIEREGKVRIEKEKIEETSEKTFSYFRSKSASARGSVSLGSFGIMYELEPGLLIFVEGSGRLAKITGFQGENKAGTSGSLFYYEKFQPDLDFWQTKYEISKKEPFGPNFRSVQEAVVDFSGFSFKIGLIIKF